MNRTITWRFVSLIDAPNQLYRHKGNQRLTAAHLLGLLPEMLKKLIT